MSLKTRGLVFATFFGNCIVVGLLLASLTTDHWVVSQAKKPNSRNATGRINFGLFSGKSELNAGIGNRPMQIDVLGLIRSEPNIMSYWLWLLTFLGTGFGLLASAIGAIASVLKSASMSKKKGTMILLFVSNSASAVSQVVAFICWLIQFYQYLTHNVLTVADQKQNWYTKELAQLGHSFFFVVAGVIIVLINLIILCVVVSWERKERRSVHEEPVDEKMAGAIMLY